jgi:hypothetical protein
MGDDTGNTISEETIVPTLWAIVYHLHGESGRASSKASSRHRSIAATDIENAIFRLWADDREKAEAEYKKSIDPASGLPSLLTPAKMSGPIDFTRPLDVSKKPGGFT